MTDTVRNAQRFDLLALLIRFIDPSVGFVRLLTTLRGMKCAATTAMGPGLPVLNPVSSFWTTPSHSFDNFRSSESLPESCDVLIIGSGYAGVSVAYHLLSSPPASGASVVMLEARQIASGATGRNGGHVKPDTYFGITKYRKLYGLQAAAEIQEFQSAQVLAVKKLVEREGLDCDFHLTRSVDVIMEPQLAKDKFEEYSELLRGGVVDMKDVAYTPKQDAERISGVKGAQCCFSFTAAHLWPKRMVQQLLERLVCKGLQVHTNTPVTFLKGEPDENGLWSVTTPRGTTKTRKVVVCTNAYTSAILPQYQDKIVPVRGVCCHISSPKGTQTPHLVNTYSIRFDSLKYDYLIPRADGSIVVGGARQAFWHNKDSWWNNRNDNENVEGTKEYFQDYMQRHFRGWEDSGAEVDHIWTGIMGYSSDLLPHIGQVPGAPGRYIAAGFSGYGMPQILTVGQELARMVKEDRPYEETVLPSVFKTTQARLDSARNDMLEGLKGAWERTPRANL